MQGNMVDTNQVNPLLIYFCKELSVQLESLSNRQATIDPAEFAELIATATHEVLDAYASGEFDLLAYRNTTSEEYKEIAQKSIESYSRTNEKIEKISEKFSDIQNHLSDEVSRANEVIHGLLEQVKTLELKTSLDPLTKVYNRYALQEHLKVILEKGILDFEIFVLMIDLDNFKQINDRFGHDLL